MKNGVLLLLGGLALLWWGLYYFSRCLEERYASGMEAGSASCEAAYQRQMAEAGRQIMLKTQEVVAYQKKLKQQQEKLDETCQEIYALDLTACRLQLQQAAD